MSNRNTECPKCKGELEWRDEHGSPQKYGLGDRRRYCTNKECGWSGRPFDTSVHGTRDYLPEWDELGCGMILTTANEDKFLYLKEGESIPEGEGWEPIETTGYLPAVCIVALVLGKKVTHRRTQTAGFWGIDDKAIVDHLC